MVCDRTLREPPTTTGRTCLGAMMGGSHERWNIYNFRSNDDALAWALRNGAESGWPSLHDDDDDGNLVSVERRDQHGLPFSTHFSPTKSTLIAVVSHRGYSWPIIGDIDCSSHDGGVEAAAAVLCRTILRYLRCATLTRWMVCYGPEASLICVIQWEERQRRCVVWWRQSIVLLWRDDSKITRRLVGYINGGYVVDPVWGFELSYEWMTSF